MRTGGANPLPAAIMAGALVIAASSAAQDSPSVSASFNPCTVCHSVDGSNGTGPTLRGVIGRRSGTVPGFRYSRAMKSAAITWDEVSLDRYFTNPQGFVPGNIMPFSGVLDGAQRADIIAYLRSLR